LTIERLTKYFILSHQLLLHFRFELAKFGTLGEAKAHFKLKANSWRNLAKKLDFLSSYSTLATDNADSLILKRLKLIEGEIKAMHVEIRQILALLTQTDDQ
jgi:hypothetical protein